MLTKMTDADWDRVLQVFAASRSRRGDKGYDAKANREAARRRGICPAIPHRSNTIAARLRSPSADPDPAISPSALRLNPLRSTALRFRVALRRAAAPSAHAVARQAVLSWPSSGRDA